MTATNGSSKIPTEAEVMGYFDSLSNWGRWGSDDWRGTLNLITPRKRVEAAQLVKEGIAVSCERPFFYTPTPGNLFPPRHFMTSAGNDVLVLGLHGGQTITHMDAPCHMTHNGTMYNGHPESLVDFNGAKEGDIAIAAEVGIVSRGVLLDIPRLKGREWLDPGEPIFPEDLEAAEKAQNVQVREGDILLVRTGDYNRILNIGFPTGDSNKRPPDAIGNWPASQWAGLQASCMPWLHERGIAVLGCDCPNDVCPSGYPNVPHKLPVHAIGLWAMGLWILDGCNHEDLAVECAKRSRWEFNLTLAPLKLVGCTGCPVNPIAVF